MRTEGGREVYIPRLPGEADGQSHMTQVRVIELMNAAETDRRDGQ